MATVFTPTPATVEEAVVLLRSLVTEKRLPELRIEDLEHRLCGSSSEKLPLKDRQLALIDDVLDNPAPTTTEDVVVAPDIEKRTFKKRYESRCRSTSSLLRSAWNSLTRLTTTDQSRFDSQGSNIS